MAIAYLLLGGNQGNRERMLETAVTYLLNRSGNLLVHSSIYETQPWGGEKQPFFLNQIVCIETDLSPEELLDEIHAIELQMGRTRNGKPFQPRIIDIDILLYDQLVYHSDRLTIPHPLLHRRAFSLMPLMEIAPEMIHPLLNKTIKELYEQNADPLQVKLYRSDIH